VAELVFIEGVSGVGKSTMVRMLSEELESYGYNVKKYLEFDYANPIDFYCTAYLSLNEYEMLLQKYITDADVIRANTIKARDVMLVRYCNEKTPLFKEPLLSELVQKEFCFKPSRLVALEEYTYTYENVWKNYASNIDETYDFIIFDGSLLHHPINDMMRNYHIDGEQAVSHVERLLDSLGDTKRWIFYLKTENIGQQLKRAHINRKQSIPTNQQIEFWENRYSNDMLVLSNIRANCHIFNISNNNWDSVRTQIEKTLTKNSYLKG